MTGYGGGSAPLEGLSVSVRVSSVNRRSLDLAISLPDEWRELESSLAEQVRQVAARGRVTLAVDVDGGGQQLGRLEDLGELRELGVVDAEPALRLADHVHRRGGDGRTVLGGADRDGRRLGVEDPRDRDRRLPLRPGGIDDRRGEAVLPLHERDAGDREERGRRGGDLRHDLGRGLTPGDVEPDTDAGLTDRGARKLARHLDRRLAGASVRRQRLCDVEGGADLPDPRDGA